MEEFQVNEHLYLVGRIVKNDGSFSHAFGVKREAIYEIKDLEVWVDLAGSEVEVSSVASDARKEALKNIWIASLQKGEVA